MVLLIAGSATTSLTLLSQLSPNSASHSGLVRVAGTGVGES